jgi:alpha-1,2-rhamnosyltransferase
MNTPPRAPSGGITPIICFPALPDRRSRVPALTGISAGVDKPGMDIFVLRHHLHTQCCKEFDNRIILSRSNLGVSGVRRPRPTVFIECTHTYHSVLNTGVQRVVRNILRHAPAVARDLGYDAVPVIVEGDRFRVADAGRVLADKQNAPDAAAATTVGRLVWRAALRCVAAALPFAGVRAFLYAPPHHPGLARGLLRLAAPFRRPAPAPAGPSGGLDDFDRYDGSILLLLDSSWATPIWPATRRFKERGGAVVGVMYDLIPLTHPHASVPELVVAFRAWVAAQLRWTDGFVCISQATADALAGQIRALGGSSRPGVRIEHFHLGADLDLAVPDAPVRQPIRDIFAADDRHVFLMVGTIEPRKMHAYVLDAFERFWARGGAAALVIVGRQSWMMPAFLERVARHPQRDRRLFVLRDASDAELDHCYRQASALVIASEIEGFGLPVVEAFQRGLPVLCSDIAVFREIADGRATFFSLSDPGHLADALSEFCRRVALGARRHRDPQGWIGWRESTEQLFAAIMRALPGSQGASPRVSQQHGG